VVRSPSKWPGWHVEVVVTPLSSCSGAAELEILTVPISVVGIGKSIVQNGAFDAQCENREEDATGALI
jgi:hypothetical protein